MIDQGHGIIRQHIAAPRDVTVGTHQNKRFLVDGSGVRVIDIDDLQRNAPRVSSGCQGRDVGDRRSEPDQHEPGAEQVEGRPAIRDPAMGRPGR